MAKAKNHYDECGIFDFADQAIVAYPVAPQTSEIAGERFAKPSWVFVSGNSLSQVSKDFVLRALIELAEFAPGAIVELNAPGHFAVSRPRSRSSSVQRLAGCSRR